MYYCFPKKSKIAVLEEKNEQQGSHIVDHSATAPVVLFLSDISVYFNVYF